MPPLATLERNPHRVNLFSDDDKRITLNLRTH